MILLLLLLQAKPTALTGGDVYTVTKGVQKGATVLVQDGKIKRVGTAFELPEGTVKIDVTGKRVLPGFVAAQARGLGVAGGPGKIADGLDPFHESIKVALAGGVTSAYVEAGGAGEGFFGGGGSGGAPPSNAVVKMTYGTLDGMVALEPASVSLSAWTQGSPSERHELRESLRKARAHVDEERDFERRRLEGKLKAGETPPKAAPAVERWLKLMRGEAVARIPAGDAERIRRALELLEEFRFRAVLTGVYEGWTLADAVGRSHAACVFSVRGMKVHPERGRTGGSSIEQAAILKKAGVRFAIVPPGLDAGTGGIPGRDLGYLPMEAAFAIRGGLDEATALEAITIRAAEACGAESRIGSIEEGKDADLVVTDGDPFDYRTFVDLTIVNGRVLYDRATSPFFSHLKAAPK